MAVIKKEATNHGLELSGYRLSERVRKASIFAATLGFVVMTGLPATPGRF